MSGAFDAGTASARLTLDLKEWSANIEKAKADTTSLAGVVAAKKNDIEKLGKAFTVAGAAIVGAIGLALKSTLDYTLEIGRMSTKTGIATETLSGLSQAADKSGLSMDELGVGMKRFSSLAFDASQGNKMATDTLHRLGVSATDASGKLKPMDQLLMETADKFKAMPNGVEKSALAVDLFGRSGTSMIAMLNRGSEGIRDFTDEAREAGMIITNEGVAKAKALSYSMKDLDDALMGVKLVIGNAIIPVVKAMTDTFTFVIVNLRKVLDVCPPLTEAITVIAGGLGAVLSVSGLLLIALPTLIKTWQNISSALTLVTTKLAATSAAMTLSLPIYAAIAAAVYVIIKAIDWFSDSCDEAIAKMYDMAKDNKRNWDYIRETIHGANTKIAESIQSARKRLTEMGYTSEEIGQIIYKQFNKIGAAAKAVAKDTEDMAKKIIDIEKQLKDKIASVTMSDYQYRIFQAKQYYADLKKQAEGSTDAAKINAEADKALALEIGKIKKEQAEKATEEIKSAWDKQVKISDEACKKEAASLLSVFKVWQETGGNIVTVGQTVAQKINSYWSDMAKNIVSKTKPATEKIQSAFSKVMDKVDGYVQVMQQGFSQYFSALSNKSDIYYQHEFAKLDKLYQKQKDALAKEYNAKIAALDAKDAAEALQARRHDILVSNMTAAEKKAALAEIDTEQKKTADRKKIEDDYAIAQAALEAKQAADKKELERRQSEETKKQNITQAYMNMFAGMVAAYKLGWPLGAIAAALTAIACKIQISNLKAQAVPMAEGGLINKPTHVLAGEAGPEAIMPMRELKRMLGVNTKKHGAGAKTVNVSISAIDASGMESFTRRTIIPEIKKAFLLEQLTVPPNAVR